MIERSSNEYLYFRFLLKYFLSSSNDNQYLSYRGQKKCIVCLAADYGNLGDVAITYAQSLYLKCMFPEHVIIDFPVSKTIGSLKNLKKVCDKDDIITIVGGGNMGDLYGDIELLRLMIVKAFPHNRIISFPQTIEYQDVNKNRFLLNLSKRIYNGHNHLLMCAREEISYSKMQELYPKCKICLVPDIVMTLDKRIDKVTRDERLITLCLRNDKEKKNTGLSESDLINILKTNGFNINIRDTHIGKSKMSVCERKLELTNIWEVFSKSRLVITDRLHGMIFAFITGTPAIVLPNSNFKIENCYNWIRKCGFIKFIKDPNVDKILDNLDLKYREDDYNDSHECINREFMQMRNIFKEI